VKLIPDSFVARRWLDALSRIECGTLTFVDPQGTDHVFTGGQPGPMALLRIHDWDAIRFAALRGDIGLGEGYIDGLWETDDIEALFSFFLVNLDHVEGFAHGNFLHRVFFVLMDTVARRNSVTGSRKNIQAHYDVGNEFYRLWLDETMTYSSALYGNEETGLADAQRRKYDRILDRFRSGKGSVLEIGCGWGGFAERATEAGLDVTGITVSPAQHRFARQRLGAKADIKLEDYRLVRGTFDRIASIEMIEAVGERYWPAYFQTVAERLKRGGNAVIQAIVIDDDIFPSYRKRSDFIRHYVFPGGMLLSLGKIREEARRAGLAVSDVFSFGQDYARTLREWTRRLKEREKDVLALGHDQAFLRNWHFYLGICASTFAVSRTDVVQVELVHA
jgi:cyclopropane-fatty-acyl-phospholipid synthase